MALAARTIVSRLSGPLRPVATEDAEPGVDSAQDALTELELDAAWRNERAFGRDGHHTPIDFVPARLKFDDFGQLLNPADAQSTSCASRADGGSIGSWYSSLPRSSSSTPAPALDPTTATPTAPPPARIQRRPKATKDDWFVQKVLAAEPAPPPSEAPTLSDMLDREPPGPAGGFKAPVWTTIGPGNRGFALLQRSGWQEGQPLGSGAAGSSQRPIETRRPVVQRQPEIVDLTGEDNDDTVDLTLDEEDSDESSDERDAGSDIEPKKEPDVDPVSLHPERDPHGTALLVPLPAFLKPDKHGIGVRALAARKELRLKSTAQAIAASTPDGTKRHQRILAASRKRREEVGRGAQGFERIGRSERDQRQAMMAYMNSS